jgi:hypothetical protein
VLPRPAAKACTTGADNAPTGWAQAEVQIVEIRFRAFPAVGIPVFRKESADECIQLHAMGLLAQIEAAHAAGEILHFKHALAGCDPALGLLNLLGLFLERLNHTTRFGKLLFFECHHKTSRMVHNFAALMVEKIIGNGKRITRTTPATWRGHGEITGLVLHTHDRSPGMLFKTDFGSRVLVMGKCGGHGGFK